jgi:hypothetical protein
MLSIILLVNQKKKRIKKGVSKKKKTYLTEGTEFTESIHSSLCAQCAESLSTVEVQVFKQSPQKEV